ncbi:MAG: acetyltransferase [Arcobacter sp.]|uniref:NeuD/PglB/VioB family sugar acetyltransferase n=1 Tax=uncultured Arcobacter sp. TaxID=165434 RepID=UPI000CC99B14|nr:NeuD/PglB/VioB family sugar acetyltransferase [uncultured Arcobacter sp.]PLY08698.1 MAG: acetyltransferase [Arcobacter sp.]
MKKENIILVGAGGHCHSVIDVIEQENKYNIIGIVDKKGSNCKEIFNYKTIGFDDDLENIYKTCKNAVITVGHITSNHARVNLFTKLKKIGFNLPIVISPLAYVSKHSFIEEGTIIMHHCLINANVKIGKNCIINTKALIEHDAIIEDHCHISTASVINGAVIVKTNSFFGSNATSKQNITISGFIKAGGISK